MLPLLVARFLVQLLQNLEAGVTPGMQYVVISIRFPGDDQGLVKPSRPDGIFGPSQVKRCTPLPYGLADETHIGVRIAVK